LGNTQGQRGGAAGVSGANRNAVTGGDSLRFGAALAFIHSSEWVHISSLDPNSPIRNENRIRTLLRARRVLPSR